VGGPEGAAGGSSSHGARSPAEPGLGDLFCSEYPQLWVGAGAVQTGSSSPGARRCPPTAWGTLGAVDRSP